MIASKIVEQTANELRQAEFRVRAIRLDYIVSEKALPWPALEFLEAVRRLAKARRAFFFALALQETIASINDESELTEDEQS